MSEQMTCCFCAMRDAELIALRERHAAVLLENADLARQLAEAHGVLRALLDGTDDYWAVTPDGSRVLDRAYAALAADRVAAYMRTEMAMPDADSDQEQNWIAGHLFTFAHRLLVAAPSAGPAATEPAGKAHRFDFDGICLDCGQEGAIAAKSCRRTAE